MKKIVTSIIMIIVSFTISKQAYSAEEVVSYDLTDHQPIETFTIEEDGETVEINIIDDSLTNYNLFARIADKTYTVSKNRKGLWDISYKISIKSNKITSAYGGSFKAIQGIFSNTSVIKNSASSAIGKGTWKQRAAIAYVQATATISDNKLIIK